ncbi:MAG: MFS transporter, partial [Alphaproteobacteria bacterium]|nr:MFS transporter [Alphaproteobacteria bacterium]
MTGTPVRLRLVDPATGAELSRLQTWLAIVVMLSGTTFVALVVTAISPIMHLVSDHFGALGYDGKTVAYGLATVPSIGIMISAPVTGWVIERMGSRNFLLVILIVFGLSGTAGLYLDDLTLLIATRLILGVSGAGIVTATLIMISEYFDADMRARILGYQAAVGAIAALTIILTAGPLAEWAGWRAPFALYFTAFPVFFVAAIAIPKRPARYQRPAAAQAGAWSALIALLGPILVITALFLGSFMPTLQVSFLLKLNGVANPAIHSLVLSASALMVGAGSAMYGPLRHRFGDRAMLAFCALSIGTGIIVMGLSHEAIQVGIGCAISGLGTGL